MDKYTLIYETSVIDYSDPYNSIIQDMKGAPKLVSVVQSKIPLSEKPTKEIIETIRDKIEQSDIKGLKIVSCKYLRTEFSSEE